MCIRDSAKASATKARPAEAPPKAPAAAPSAPEAPKAAAEEGEEEETPVTRQYQLAVLQAVHKLGGTGKAARVVQMIPQVMVVPVEHLGTYARGPEGKSEQPKYVKFVHSARRFLIHQGQLESPDRGMWRITSAGLDRLKKAGLA